MASVPAPLKAVDVGRFALRATQLEKIKPQISYWLTLYIVEIILKNGMEKSSEECMLYTAGLMDKLEGWKTEHASDQTIHDDIAAQAFVEQFALSTFERADKAMRSRKTTYQTADTFQAARTFLDLMSIWQKPLDVEIAAKSKYAKYHALRILKAIKAGEDPNLPEELQEPEPEPAPALHPSDPEVQNIISMQPTVEDTEDQASSHLALAQPGIPSISTTHAAGQDVSPLEPELSTGYFPGASPQIPTFTADDSAPALPTASASDPMDISHPPTSVVSPISPQDYYAQQPQHPPSQQSQDPTSLIPPSEPQDPPTPALNHASARTISQFQTPPPPPAGAPAFAAPSLPTNPTQQPFWSNSPMNHHPTFQDDDAAMTNGPPIHHQQQQYKTDDEAILSAQKHGKWALSALNFDDVETAVKEFRIALRHLGAL